MSKDLVLAIDNGTQGVRALLFDLRGNLIAKSRVPIDSYDSPKPGWAEQAPDVFWKAVCEACQLRAQACTKRPGWELPSMGQWGWDCIPILKPPFVK